MTELKDIVHDANPHIRRRKADATIVAGDVVYLTGDSSVTPTTNGSVGFEGVAMESVASGDYLGVALAPTEVYVNTSEAVSANELVMPDASGFVQQWEVGDSASRAIICGRVVEGGSAASTCLIRLMDIPTNESST